MLDKLAIGTANFTQPYGVMSSGEKLSDANIKVIIETALSHGIATFDTAFAYGDHASFFTPAAQMSKCQIVTKFSVLEDFNDTYKKIVQMQEVMGSSGVYALLIHDPNKIAKCDKKALLSFLSRVREQELVAKIGVSVYEPTELGRFCDLIIPELVQVPVNPLNQTFLDPKFRECIIKDQIEVHARSLFLQGILLADRLPDSLQGLSPLWRQSHQILQSCDSKLEGLIAWAKSINWISKWVIGIAALKDLQEIITIATQPFLMKEVPNFEPLKGIKHPLVDPRNWASA